MIKLRSYPFESHYNYNPTILQKMLDYYDSFTKS